MKYTVVMIMVSMSLICSCADPIVRHYRGLSSCEKIQFLDSIYGELKLNCPMRTLKCDKYPFDIEVNGLDFMLYIIDDVSTMTGYFGSWNIMPEGPNPSLYNSNLDEDILKWREILNCNVQMGSSDCDSI